MPPPARVHLGLLLLLLLAHAALVGAYALLIPLWQAPDEPAHANYAAQVARDGCCPVIAPGDWDSAYLAALTGGRFAPPLLGGLAAVQYEDHQPPLYYLLGAWLVRLPFGDDLRALRLAGVLCGIGVVLCAWGVARVAWPDRPWAPLATAGLVAFVPQHVAVLAGANNDALALLIAAATTLSVALMLRLRAFPAAMRWVLVGSTVGVGGLAALAAWPSAVGVLFGVALVLAGLVAALARRLRIGDEALWALTLGVLLGAAFWTKTTIYALAALAGGAIVLRPLVALAGGPLVKTLGTAQRVLSAISAVGRPTSPAPRRPPPGSAWRVVRPLVVRALRPVPRRLALTWGVGLALGALWWVRNVAVYGGWDVFGLGAHDAVVVGQLRTSDAVAAAGGWGAYIAAAGRTTFHSFWGQMGWMSAPLPGWAYTLITLMLCAAALGLGLHVVERVRAPRPRPSHDLAAAWAVWLLLAGQAVLVAAAFVAYNATYSQPQGRYLFPALIPFALLVAGGLDALAQRLARLVPIARAQVLFPAVMAYAPWALALFDVWFLRQVVPYLSA